MVEKVVRIFDSMEEANEADRAYRLSLSPEERMEILRQLIERGKSETAEGFERVYRIIELT